MKKTMIYRDRLTANTINEERYTALTLNELFSQTAKLNTAFDGSPVVELGSTALAKMDAVGFLSRSSLSVYAFGSLGFTNAITATALIAANVYGFNRVYIGSRVHLDIDRVNHLPQANYFHFTAYAYAPAGLQVTRFCLTASFKDSTAEKKAVNDRPANRSRGYIPLDKTDRGDAMQWCEHIYIGNYDAFSFSVE